MLQTVLRIPHEVGGLPVFGWGWVAIALAVGLLGVIITALARPAMRDDVIQTAPMLAVLLVVSVWVMPQLEERGPGEMPLGLPIRGYGVMLVAGVVSGFALTVARGRRMGFHPDRVLTMLIGMFVSGILGARVFHVIQYWDRIRVEDSIVSTLVRIIKFNEGGLVVYGAMIAGLAWVVCFAWREKWSLLRTGDMIAPGMLLGLALGRIGCLLNGCCHGGACDGEMFALQFPQASPPYMSQLERGELLGADFEADGRGVVVRGVRPGLAEAAGVRPGARVLVLPSDKNLRDSRMLDDGRAMVVIETESSNAKWTVDDLPPRSLPTRPAQIYSSINATLLCLLLLAIHPYRTRDGQLLLSLLTLYPVTRFLLELVRTDEPGRFGTALTISQWVSVGMLALAALGWVALQRNWLGRTDFQSVEQRSPTS